MARNFFTDRMDVTGNQLVERVKEIAQDANARRVVIKDQDGRQLLVVPLGWGAAGGALTLLTAPWLVALAAVGAAMSKVRVEVERVDQGQDQGWDQPRGETSGTGQDLGSQAAGSPPDETADGMPLIHTDAPGWDAPPSDESSLGRP